MSSSIVLFKQQTNEKQNNKKAAPQSTAAALQRNARIQVTETLNRNKTPHKRQPLDL